MALVNELYNGLRIKQSSERSIIDGFWYGYLEVKRDGQKPIAKVSVKLGDKKAMDAAMKKAKEVADVHLGNTPSVTITQEEKPKKKFRGTMTITTEGPATNPRITDAVIEEEGPVDPLKGPKAWRDNLDRFQKGGKKTAKKAPGATKSTPQAPDIDEDY